MSPSDDYGGMEKATEKCDACNTPVTRLVKVRVLNNYGKIYEDELWCLRCFIKEMRRLDRRSKTDNQLTLS